MNSILGQVRNLALITHLMMMQLEYSDLQEGFYSQILAFVTFDVIPTDELYETVFIGIENEPYSD